MLAQNFSLNVNITRETPRVNPPTSTSKTPMSQRKETQTQNGRDQIKNTSIVS